MVKTQVLCPNKFCKCNRKNRNHEGVFWLFLIWWTVCRNINCLDGWTSSDSLVAALISKLAGAYNLTVTFWSNSAANVTVFLSILVTFRLYISVFVMIFSRLKSSSRGYHQQRIKNIAFFVSCKFRFAAFFGVPWLVNLAQNVFRPYGHSCTERHRLHNDDLSPFLCTQFTRLPHLSNFLFYSFRFARGILKPFLFHLQVVLPLTLRSLPVNLLYFALLILFCRCSPSKVPFQRSFGTNVV